MLKGTDISAYQDTIPAGDFCILKATEGTGYIDPPFVTRWKHLLQNGTLRGAYHFAHPSNDPTAEVDFFLSIVQPAGLTGADLLCLDFEVDDNMSVSHCAQWARTWCQRVQTVTGQRPVVYTFLSFAEAGNCDGLGSYPLWMADPSRPAGQPRVPAPWTDWVLHQYGSPSGVDVDVFKGSRNDWLALSGGRTTSISEDDDMPQGMLNQHAVNLTDPKNTPISVPAGKYKFIGFAADNGYFKHAPASLRVAQHVGGGNWTVHPVTVDSTKDKATLAIDPKADQLSITYADDGVVPVGWDIS